MNKTLVFQAPKIATYWRRTWLPRSCRGLGLIIFSSQKCASKTAKFTSCNHVIFGLKFLLRKKKSEKKMAKECASYNQIKLSSDSDYVRVVFYIRTLVFFSLFFCLLSFDVKIFGWIKNFENAQIYLLKC